MRVWRWGILGLGIAAYFAATIVWLQHDHGESGAAFDSSSVFDRSPRGLSLAYAYLRGAANDRGVSAAVGTPSAVGTPKVRTLARSVDVIELEPDAIVLRVVSPSEPLFSIHWRDPKDDEGETQDPSPQPILTKLFMSQREEEWVRGGGRLFIAFAGEYGPLRTKPARSKGRDPARKVFPLWPRVTSVEPATGRVLSGALRGSHTLLLLGDFPAISRWTFGQGEVIVSALPEILQNEQLGGADHLAFLEEIAGRGRAVYFDETVHGSRDEAGLFELLRRWNFGPLLALLAFAAAAALWRGTVRLGTPDEADAETRSEAVDLVDSLAQLYERALPRRALLAMYARTLSRAIAADTGLRGAALAARVKDLTGGREMPKPSAGHDLDVGMFKSLLAIINEAFRRLDHARHR